MIQTLAGQVALAIEGTRLGSEAEEARLEAETNRLRAALFSSVTHDLRTPLASITASVSSPSKRDRRWRSRNAASSWRRSIRRPGG